MSLDKRKLYVHFILLCIVYTMTSFYSHHIL